MTSLAGRLALVTGASRGIGVFIAEALARESMRLVLVARSRDQLEEVRSRIGGTEVSCYALDLSDRRALEDLVPKVAERHGDLEVLVNNAGLQRTEFYEGAELDLIEQVIAVNLTAPLLLSRLVLPGMLARDSGHIVQVSSIAGLGPAAFDEVYGSTKHGLVGFSRSLRASLKTRGSNVSASVICPGHVSDVGLHARDAERFGVLRARGLGVSRPASVADAVVDAIRDDRGEVLVDPQPLRPLLSLGALFPGTLERAAAWLGANDYQYAIAKKRAQGEHDKTSR